MFRAIITAFLLVVPGFAAERFDSDSVMALDATVTGANVLLPAGQEALAAQFARNQLQYVVGHLNGFGGGADIAKAVITLKEVRATEIIYDAKLVVAWPRQYAPPKRFETVAPRQADAAGKADFFKRYGAACQSEENAADAEMLFYYYRPQNRACRVLQNPDLTIASRLSLSLVPSPLQTSGKYPEYDKIWEDGRLSGTFLFGTYDDGATSNRDHGVLAYGQAYRALRRLLGQPVMMSPQLSALAEPGLQNPEISMEFAFRDGRKIDLRLFLIQKNSMQKVTPEFAETYAKQTETADFVSFNGHSDLGGNIRALSKLGRFVKGQYQIFMVNGCDTFSYLDDSLRQAHEAVNPGESPSKYFDLISNAAPSQFGDDALNAVQFVRALVEKKATYAQLLSSFGRAQRALVTGEEDNHFPAPF